MAFQYNGVENVWNASKYSQLNWLTCKSNANLISHAYWKHLNYRDGQLFVFEMTYKISLVIFHNSSIFIMQYRTGWNYQFFLQNVVLRVLDKFINCMCGHFAVVCLAQYSILSEILVVCDWKHIGCAITDSTIHCKTTRLSECSVSLNTFAAINKSNKRD